MAEPFITAARAETMLRDFDRLRKAIRAWDAEATEAAWVRCEPWIDQLRPIAHYCACKKD